MIKQVKALSIGFLLTTLLLLFNGCQFGRFVFYNFANITDYKIFASRPLKSAETKFIFNKSLNAKSPKALTVDKNKSVTFDKYLEQNNTVAFLIIKNDSIQYEKYFKGYDEQSIVASFSMAKSVTSMLIGCALDEHLIQSVEEPITNYIPELKARGFEKVKIKHLLQMTSGIKFNESYINPFGDAASFYYGLNLRKAISKMKMESEPGKKFEYKSGNTQVLGLVLERALKNKSVSNYLQEKLWSPLGMEYDATWSIDQKKNGLEKTFCCINARARDFAKLGRLYKNKGNWNGEQLVSKAWVEESTKLDTSEGAVDYYRYQWWIPTPNQDFMAEGHLGQFIYVNPAKDLIIVRLGKSEGRARWWQIFTSLAKSY